MMHNIEGGDQSSVTQYYSWVACKNWLNWTFVDFENLVLFLMLISKRTGIEL